MSKSRMIRTGSMRISRRLIHRLKAFELRVHGFLSPNCATTFSKSFVHCEHGQGCSRQPLMAESWRLR